MHETPASPKFKSLDGPHWRLALASSSIFHRQQRGTGVFVSSQMILGGLHKARIACTDPNVSCVFLSSVAVQLIGLKCTFYPGQVDR